LVTVIDQSFQLIFSLVVFALKIIVVKPLSNTRKSCL